VVVNLFNLIQHPTHSFHPHFHPSNNFPPTTSIQHLPSNPNPHTSNNFPPYIFFSSTASLLSYPAFFLLNSQCPSSASLQNLSFIPFSPLLSTQPLPSASFPPIKTFIPSSSSLKPFLSNPKPPSRTTSQAIPQFNISFFCLPSSTPLSCPRFSSSVYARILLFQTVLKPPPSLQ
jgi:hypothetical protein